MPSFVISFDYWPLLLSLILASAIICLGGAVWAAARGRDPVLRRVDALAQGRSAGPSEASRALSQIMLGFLRFLARPALPKRSWELSRIKNDLLFAGLRSPHAVQIYLGIRVFFCLVAPVLAWLSPLDQRVNGPVYVLVLVGASAVGFMLPKIWLEMVSKKRRAKISRELPDVLDLMVIAVEAGLGLDAAIRRVSKEVKLSSPILSGELNMVSLELKAGIPRQQCLRNLGARCGVDEVSSLVTMLIQADRFGVSVGRSLRVHSDTVRTKRRQKLEEQAAKVPLKLLFPVLFLIFPAIMVVMAGPAIIKVSESILK